MIRRIRGIDNDFTWLEKVKIVMFREAAKYGSIPQSSSSYEIATGKLFAYLENGGNMDDLGSWI